MTTASTQKSSACPCGSGNPLETCCLPVIAGRGKAPTAEALLRARYTAFMRQDIDFIFSTHHSRTRAEVKREEIEDWSKNSEFLSLKILESQAGGAADPQGTVSFVAQYRGKADGKVVEHAEQSLFEREDGDWRFVDARSLKNEPIRRTEAKTGRNDPCPCGSGKKFKKCHG